MLIWGGGSFLLRWVLNASSSSSTSVYGPLAAPIAIMLWLYTLAIAILIGAAFNAAVSPPPRQPATPSGRSACARQLIDRSTTVMLVAREAKEPTMSNVNLPTPVAVVAGVLCACSADTSSVSSSDPTPRR